MMLEMAGPGLRQGQKCGGIELTNGIPNPPLLIIGSPTAKMQQYYWNTSKSGVKHQPINQSINSNTNIKQTIKKKCMSMSFWHGFIYL